MWSWCAIVLVCTTSFACRQILGVDDLPDAPPCTETLFGSGDVQVCTTIPSEPVSLTGTFDTDTAITCVTRTLRDGTAACVVGGSTVDVSLLVGVGSLPLVIVATEALRVSGSLDVASHRGVSARGAGADPTACGVATVATRTSDGGGGAGGTFATVGGDGGPGFEDGVGAVAVATTEVTGFRGGCPGSDGANADDNGVPGRGGGAVFLIAGTSIAIASTINASGEGGRNGSATGGGGGGGSGGMIGLDAPAITIADTAVVIAHGGGGGEGGGNVNGGQDGDDPTPTSPPTAAQGGGDTVSGGDGGDGAIGAMTGGAGLIGLGATPSGGGGGGGGVGVVIVLGTLTGGGTISPPQR